MGSSSVNNSIQSNTNTLPKASKTASTELIKTTSDPISASPKRGNGVCNMSSSLVSSDTISSSPISLDSRSSFAKADHNSDSQHQTEFHRKQIESLQMEISRISRQYEQDIGRKISEEEKVLSFKKIAEEKQIESAALKFEYRKMKEALSAENSMLKSFLAR